MTLDTIIKLVTALFGSGFIITIISAVNSLKRKYESDKSTQDDHIKAIKYGLLELLKDRLLQGVEHYKNNGYATYTQKETWLSMYDAYHVLGGNGVVTKAKDELLNLPLKGE